jgi:hypothetical protein
MDNRQRTTSRIVALIMISVFSALMLAACAGMNGGMPAAAGSGQITPTPALVFITATNANGDNMRGTLANYRWETSRIPATLGPDDSRIVYTEYVPGPITFSAKRAPQYIDIMLVQLEGGSGEPPLRTQIQPGAESMEWDPGALSPGKYLIMITAKFAEGSIDFMYGITVTERATAEPTSEATAEPTVEGTTEP